MIHAKTLVADGIWSRVGSSNMNSASLLGNWEIDVGVLDEMLAAQMEGLYLADLASAIEIVLPRRLTPVAQLPLGIEEGDGDLAQATLDPGRTLQERFDRLRAGTGASAPWGVPALVRAGSSLGDAIAGHRTLGREDRTVLGTAALLIFGVGLFAAFFPWIVGWFVAFVAGWFGIVLGVRGLIQARRARKARELDEEEDRDIEPPDGGSSDTKLLEGSGEGE
jgi:cardiolipin synthase